MNLHINIINYRILIITILIIKNIKILHLLFYIISFNLTSKLISWDPKKFFFIRKNIFYMQKFFLHSIVEKSLLLYTFELLSNLC